MCQLHADCDAHQGNSYSCLGSGYPSLSRGVPELDVHKSRLRGPKSEPWVPKPRLGDPKPKVGTPSLGLVILSPGIDKVTSHEFSLRKPGLAKPGLARLGLARPGQAWLDLASLRQPGWLDEILLLWWQVRFRQMSETRLPSCAAWERSLARGSTKAAGAREAGQAEEPLSWPQHQ